MTRKQSLSHKGFMVFHLKKIEIMRGINKIFNDTLFQSIKILFISTNFKNFIVITKSLVVNQIIVQCQDTKN
jgi:hypothetical protein